MKKILCFVLSSMLLLSGMTALAKPVEIELRGTDYSNYEGVKAEGYEGTVVTGDAKHWRPQDKSKIYPLAENKNEAGTGKALYLPNTQLDNIAANAPGFRLVAMGDPLLLEVGKSYAMKVKMRALTPSTKDIKVESLWRPQKDYTCSATDDGQYKVTAGTPFRPVAYYPANSTEWMTVEIPPFAIKAIKNAAGENVDSMMPSGGNLPFIYIYTQDDADGNKVEFYIESAFIYEVDDGKHNITVASVQNGQVLCDGSNVAGSSVEVEYGGGKTFTIQPDSGFLVDTVTCDGAPLVLDNNNTVTIDHVVANRELAVTFKAEGVTDPEIILNSDNIIQSIYTDAEGGESYNSTLVYFRVTKPDLWDWERMEYGMCVTDVQTGVSYLCKALKATADGRFGIRIYGAALKPGQVLRLKGYLKENTSSESVYSSEQEVTIEERQ